MSQSVRPARFPGPSVGVGPGPTTNPAADDTNHLRFGPPLHTLTLTNLNYIQQACRSIPPLSSAPSSNSIRWCTSSHKTRSIWSLIAPVLAISGHVWSWQATEGAGLRFGSSRIEFGGLLDWDQTDCDWRKRMTKDLGRRRRRGGRGRGGGGGRQCEKTEDESEFLSCACLRLCFWFLFIGVCVSARGPRVSGFSGGGNLRGGNSERFGEIGEVN